MKARAIVFGGVVAVLGIALDIGMARLFHQFWAAEVLGNTLTGAAAGYALFRYMAYRVELSKQRAAQIAYLNHHIRNAMQGIVSSRYAGDEQQRLDVLNACCDRVTETLRRFTAEDNLSLEALQENPALEREAPRQVGAKAADSRR